MATTASGGEFKRFYADPVFWPGESGDTWHEDAVLSVDGVVFEDGIDVDVLADEAVVTIEGGVVFSTLDGWREPTLESHFKKWRRRQTTVLFLVECDRQALEVVKTAIRNAGGRC